MKETKSETTAVWIALNLAYRSVHRDIESALKEEELPPLRWYDVLWELELSDSGMRPMELERGLLFEQSNLSRTLRRIIDEGLVEERAFKGDGRGKVLHITAAGRRMRKRMWEIYGPKIESHFGNIQGTHDIEALAAALKSLVR